MFLDFYSNFPYNPYKTYKTTDRPTDRPARPKMQTQNPKHQTCDEAEAWPMATGPRGPVVRL